MGKYFYEKVTGYLENTEVIRPKSTWISEEDCLTSIWNSLRMQLIEKIRKFIVAAFGFSETF